MGLDSQPAITNKYFTSKANESSKIKFSKGEIQLRFYYRMKTVGSETLDTT